MLSLSLRLRDEEVTVIVTILIDQSNNTVKQLLQAFMSRLQTEVDIENSTIARYGIVKYST